MRLLAPAVVVLLVAGCGHAAPTGSYEIPIQVLKHGKQVIALVPVTIDGHGPFTFAVDTGASQSLVDSGVARRLDAHATGDSHRVAGITNVANVRTIRVEHWRVGKVRLPATTIVEANLPFGSAAGGVQGLLGSDMLGEFDVVTIDYGHELLRLHHRG